jgi:hypothetical protein
LPVVLYGWETWSLILRKEPRLRTFHNREMRRIFGLKRYEIIGYWRKFHNEELHNLYSSPNIGVITVIKPRSMRQARHAPRIGETNAYRVSVESQKERDHQEDLDVDRRIILKRT